MTTRRTILKTGLALPFLSLPVWAQATTGVLRYGLSAFPANLQPWANVGSAAGIVKMLIHRSLVAYDNKGELRGDLAISWSVDDQGVWTFKLRPDAFFHNSEPVTADDVKWSIEQVADDKSTAGMRPQMQEIIKIETPDAHTVKLTTKTPTVTLPLWFANYNMFIIWRKSQPNDPIGAGPFRLAGQERGTSLDLTAFEKFYRPGIPRLKGIKFIVYADENLRMAALQSGDVDTIEYVPYQSMAAVENNPRLKLDAVEGAIMYMQFNGSKPPFDNPLVRRAIAHAVRREDIVKAAFSGRGKPLEGVPIVEDSPWYDKELAQGWNYDPERSKALLAQAGYPNGFETTLLAAAQYAMHKDTAEVVQQHLAAVGVQSDLRLTDWATRVSRGTSGQYDIAILGGSASNNDPDGLSALLDTSGGPTLGTSFGLKAPRTNAAFARGRAEFDQAKRVEIYKEMQRAALEEVPMVGLVWRMQGYAMDKRVKGFTNLPGMLTNSSGGMLAETYFE